MALAALQESEPAVLISDVRMPEISGLELLQQAQQLYPELPCIIITAHSDLENAVAAYKHGAFEYLPKPFDIDDVIAVVNRALAHRNESILPEINSPVIPMLDTGGLIGQSAAMQEVFRTIGRLSSTNISVLINGVGDGKVGGKSTTQT